MKKKMNLIVASKIHGLQNFLGQNAGVDGKVT
jgi:hypothetical protein